MLKLMKYELRKTWMSKAILLGITAVAEAVYLFGLYGDNEETTSTGITLLMLLAIGGIMVIGLESVITLHRDMNTKQSHMLFMTPNTCYTILGAKITECATSVFLTGAFFFALGALDLTLLFAKMGQLSTLWDQIQSFLSRLTVNGRAIRFDTATMAAMMFSILSSWIGLIATAYLSDVISSALLNGKKYNGLISFVLFLALEGALAWLSAQATTPIQDPTNAMLVSGGIDLVLATGMYFLTAFLMDKYLSV